MEVLEQNPDPKVVTDADFFKRIMETKLPWRVKDIATGIEMLLVPPGTFMMGASPGDTQAGDVEKPAHEVTITNAFYLGRTPVIQKQWKRKMVSNPSLFRLGIDSPSRPVDQVSWNDCQQFCANTGMKLPTEAQWEYACRAGTKGATYGDLDLIAWHYGNAAGFETTHAVGKLQPNALGFFDMLGNVWEWCEDWDGPYSSGSVTNPTGPTTGLYRLLRGGDWSSYSDDCRASERHRFPPGLISHDGGVGFRVVRTPDKLSPFQFYFFYPF